MKNVLLINLFAILLFALIGQPAFVFGNTIYFDLDGNIVDNAQYEKDVLDREKRINMKLHDGYNEKSNDWKDPIKLRKNRIEQWRIMRSDYDPDSLPNKIENPSATKK
jgi:hypothetical protein